MDKTVYRHVDIVVFLLLSVVKLFAAFLCFGCRPLYLRHPSLFVVSDFRRYLLFVCYIKGICMQIARFLSLTFIVALVLGASGCARLITPKLNTNLQEVSSGNYIIDKNHSTVLFKVGHMGFSKFVGRFNRFDAELEFNPENIESSTLSAIVDMSSIDVNNPSFEESLKGRFWFDVNTYPQAIFSTTSAKKVSDSQVEFFGNLEFLGETQVFSIMVTFNGAALNLLTQKYTLGFEASGSLMRSDYGLDQYIPAVGDEITLEVFAEFQKK